MTDGGCNASSVTHLNEKTPDSRKVNKRRSTVFQRRSLVFQSEKGIDSDETIKENEIGENSKEPFNLKEYIDSLRHERKAWIETLNERKRRRRDLLKQKSKLQQCEQNLDLNILSDSERSFVLGRPNYEHICKNGISLSDAAVKLVILNQHVTKLNQRFVLKVEGTVDELTKKIIKMVD